MSDHRDVFRQVLRRVRYATNTLALLDNRVPPEGPFDTALTNGLLAIVAHDMPGAEMHSKKLGHLLSARELLAVIESTGPPSFIAAQLLADGLDVTQPVRHGREDDEFAVLSQEHVAAVVALDQHPALRFLNSARGRTLDECAAIGFRERASEELPSHPRDRLDFPEPEECPQCLRETFLRWGWDDFGGSASAGECIVCAYERSPDEAHAVAVDQAMARHFAEVG